MLGHKDAAMTLNVNASLFEDDLDDVSDRLDAALLELLRPVWSLNSPRRSPNSGCGSSTGRPQKDPVAMHRQRTLIPHIGRHLPGDRRLADPGGPEITNIGTDSMTPESVSPPVSQ
jgi:hypothetical protein